MRLLLSRNLIVTAARRFAEAYSPAEYPPEHKFGKAREELIALDAAAATAREVADIIGNQSWSYVSCDECSQYVEQAVQIGGEYERQVTLCPSCLRAAAALGSVVL